MKDNSQEIKVATLLPSATEIVCLLGAGPNLVAVSHECDYPPVAVGKRIITSSKVSFSLSSLEIDQDVRRILEHALGVYDIDTEALSETAPDVIVTQDLCDVCAVSYNDVERAARELLSPDVKLVNLKPTRLAEVLDGIVEVGSALGVEERAKHELALLQQRIDAISERASKLTSRPKVLTIEWIDPVMVGGTWMPELVELAGGEALVTKAGDHAPTLNREQLAALRPDVVLIKPCGFDLARTAQEAGVLSELIGSMPWPACSEERVFVADGNAFFNRPGPRLVESLEILAACVHPSEFGDLAAKRAGDYVPLASLATAVNGAAE